MLLAGGLGATAGLPAGLPAGLLVTVLAVHGDDDEGWRGQ